MRNIVSPLDGFLSPFGRRFGNPFASLMSQLLSGASQLIAHPLEYGSMFQDRAGTTPVTAPGQLVGHVLDAGGGGYHATAISDAARGVYAVVPETGRRNLLTYTDLIEPKDLSVTPQAYTLSFDSGSQFKSAVMGDIVATAVDVFVYDTSKDSDGGAWRTGALAQASSWYNETLNTATRGSRREFPAVAVIVAESNKVTIYDGDDPTLPMWMVFENNIADLLGGGGGMSSISFINGVLAVGTSDRLNYISFIQDFARRHRTTGIRVYSSALAGRNDGSGFDAELGLLAIVNTSVHDVAMTVLPDAPIDPATGLPVPTIAVATDGGVSVIKDDGTVASDNHPVSVQRVGILGEDLFSFIQTSTGYVAVRRNFHTRTGVSVDNFGLSSGAEVLYRHNSVPALFPVQANNAILKFDSKDFGFNQGLFRLNEDQNTPSKGMVAYTTSTYNTGWMVGDIKGAFLSDTDDTDLVGGTDADRSVNNNPLTVNGTVTRTAVATGAELVGCSGFSASNFLEQPYNPDLDFGTGDFCVMGWVKTGVGGIDRVISRDSATTAQRFSLYVDGSGNAVFLCDDDTTTRVATSASSVISNTWRHVCGIYDGAGGVYVYVDGALVGSATGSALLTLNNAAATLVVGNDQSGSNAFGGSIALLHISATAPTAEQVAKIYNDEKVLFQENAAATLHGASDSVTALAHDSDTDLLHVGTNAGRSVFDGLRRIDNTTDPITTAISAVGGYIAEE